MNHRPSLDAVRGSAEAAEPGRDPPARFGRGDSVWRRFDRWAETGVWLPVREVPLDLDLEGILLDSTAARGHHHAAAPTTRSEETARNSLGFVHVAAVMGWLRQATLRRGLD